MLKEYRIRRIKEYIAEADAEIDTILELFKDAGEISIYYADRLILARQKKSVFELRLKDAEV